MPRIKYTKMPPHRPPAELNLRGAKCPLKKLQLVNKTIKKHKDRWCNNYYKLKIAHKYTLWARYCHRQSEKKATKFINYLKEEIDAPEARKYVINYHFKRSRF